MIKKYAYLFDTYGINRMDIYDSLTKRVKKAFMDKVLLITGIDYNVDHVIRKSEFNDQYDIASYVRAHHLNKIDFWLENHLKFLGRQMLNYVIVSEEDGWQDLVRVLKNRKEIGALAIKGYSKEFFNEFLQITGSKPAFVILDIMKFQETEFLERLTEIQKEGVPALVSRIFMGNFSRILMQYYPLEQILGYYLDMGCSPIIHTINPTHAGRNASIIEMWRDNSLYVKDIYPKLRDLDIRLNPNQNEYILALQINGRGFITIDSRAPYYYESKKIIDSNVYKDGYHLFAQAGYVKEDSGSWDNLGAYLAYYKYKDAKPDDPILCTDDMYCNPASNHLVSFIAVEDGPKVCTTPNSIGLADIFMKEVNLREGLVDTENLLKDGE